MDIVKTPNRKLINENIYNLENSADTKGPLRENFFSCQR